MNLKPGPQRRLRVLVVEDNLDSVHSMAKLIQAMGHDVEFAINGYAAMAIARTFRPDLVLLDVGLPDFKGDQVARKLKRQAGLDKLRIIAISGLPRDEVRQRVLAAGCEELYTKPLDPAVLEQLLAKS